jgi:SGNH domain (fused to AT3 domains)
VLRRSPAVLLAVLAGLLAATAGPAHAASLRFEPVSHHDARDVAGSPLDVTSVTFGQLEARLVLHLRTRASWSASDLDQAAGRALCIELFYGSRSTPRSRMCVLNRNGKAALEYQDLNAAGQIDSRRPVPASVSRPNKRRLEAGFTRVEVGLPRGRFRWRVVSSWTDAAACAITAPCLDLAPNHGAYSDRIGFVAGPRCFGAASRNHCSNPRLRLAVVPTPAAAKRGANAFCASGSRVGLVGVCTFGVSEELASTSVALVGDSHAQHWRGALEVVAQAKHWHGLSITRSGCPLTRAQPILPGKVASQKCREWNNEVQAWFERHPEVSTVVMSAHAGAKTTGGTQAGYRAAWHALPPSVKHIVVIHDTPSIGKVGRCIQRAIAKRKRAGLACAVPRSRGLHRDEHYLAARGMGGTRVRTIDMTRFFCGGVCPPVIGGALVYKDGTHMTRIFAGTLGQFLLKRINRVT